MPELQRLHRDGAAGPASREPSHPPTAIAYDKMAIEIWGERAKTNFSREYVENKNPQKVVFGTSEYIGVSWHKRDLVWQAYITGEQLGYFDDEIDAALARDIRIIELFGENIETNLPMEYIKTHIPKRNILKKSSNYRGICWDNERKKWMASVCVNRKNKFSKRFNSEIEAAKYYDKCVVENKLNKRLNFTEDYPDYNT